jgi:ABC-type transport system involved in multi-copper enzyme maturation permease subunit
VCAVAFLVVFSVAVVFAYREMASDGNVSFIERQGTLTAIMLVGFMAANFLSVIFAILLPIDTLSGEIDSGVVQTLASKPIDRAHIVLGKWAGHLLLAFAYLLLLTAGILLVIRMVSGLAPPGVARAVPLLMLEIALSLTVAVAGGARFGFYGVAFIGGFVEQLGTFAGIKSMRITGIVVSLFSPADSMWRLAAHYMEPEILRSTGALALGGTVPSQLMVWWAVGFTVLMLLYAIRAFRRRAL